MAKPVKKPATSKLDDLIEADALDLSVDGFERAKFFHEGHKEWTRIDHLFKTQRQAGQFAARWNAAAPESFGSDGPRLEAEVVKLIPRDWWKQSKSPVASFGVRARIRTSDEPGRVDASNPASDGNHPTT